MSFDKFVSVQIEDKVIEGLEISFDTQFDSEDESLANLIIYNLSEGTIEEIKEKDRIIITAGFIGKEAVVFRGEAAEVNTKVNINVATTIRCIDKDLKRSNYFSQTVTSGTNEQLIRTIANKLGITVRSITMDLVQNNLGRTLVGNGLELINKLAVEGNAFKEIKNNILDIRQDKGRIIAIVDAKSGLIDKPQIKKEKDETKYIVETVFDNRIIINEQVKVIYSTGEVILKVDKVKHNVSRSEFLTTFEGELIA